MADPLDTDQEVQEISQQSLPPFAVTEVRFTYNRTIQVAQFSPVNPMATVVVQVNDPSQVDAALSYARDIARQHVRDELATVAPALLRQMDEAYLDKWLATAPPEQIAHLQTYFDNRSPLEREANFWK